MDMWIVIKLLVEFRYLIRDGHYTKVIWWGGWLQTYQEALVTVMKNAAWTNCIIIIFELLDEL